MDLLANLNRALQYIEENLADDIDLKEAARLARCSEYHFSRMFSFLAGIPLSEYIRRRRLTSAAFELQTGELRVMDVAVKYGYSSADAFSRAFQGLHGIPPSSVKLHGPSLKAYPRLTFQLTIQGGSAMNYRIIEKEPFCIAGITRRVPIQFNGVNQEIVSMWKSLTSDDIDQLKKLSNVEPQGLIQASMNFSEGRMEEEGELDHYVGVATTKECPEHLTKLDVPAATWAVFEAVGPFPDTLQNVWGRIYSEWFPTANYELAIGPEILWNESKDISSPTFRSEVWIPVLKK
ncbi:AraC family transcriptional regulator [Paenibacillus crassostreae]|uniref:AraC family transcriptional regulator n=1 Tax=Paenibacillus crassostreae TaxID=1763538 RepID=A0A162KPY1_9BACL|nr:AraC family transcriptional regulator [Paenibacillus crassostreae]AOZ92929.1 AraC family transcriptional regulator [Paenibacillus crassostreae]OAB71983.1 AraC family transcriptional regulator [Paenibacillus crassostreae]